MSEKKTIIERGQLFEGIGAEAWISVVGGSVNDIGRSYQLHALLPEEARDWCTGRFEITVKFIKEEP